MKPLGQKQPMSKQSPFNEFTLVAVQAALKAGEIIKRGWGTDFIIEAKPGRQNFVTEYDRSSEKSIISFIQDYYPNHSILAEESGFSKKDETYTWIIDPLDGTTNFSRHIPLFVVSIALADEKGSLSGVIYQPITHELFIAERGRGAYLNGQRLSVSKNHNFSDMIIGIGLPYDVEDSTLDCIDHLTHFARQGLTLRNLGSAALNLAYVAAGRFDAMILNKLSPWDHAAGSLLVEEAGGEVTDFLGKPLNSCESTSIIATNHHLHSELLSQIQQKKT